MGMVADSMEREDETSNACDLSHDLEKRRLAIDSYPDGNVRL